MTIAPRFASLARTALVLASMFVFLALAPSKSLAQPHEPPPAGEVAAHAEQAGHDKAGVLPSVAEGIVPMIVSLLVFGVVFAMLAVFVWPKITKGLNDRADKIREEIESAEQARQQAKEALDQYQQSLSQARAEAQKMLEQAKVQQLALSAELKAKADVELSQMRERATRDIETAKRAAITEIYTHAANLAAHAASKILRREISAGDNQALVDESVRQLQSTSN